LNFSLSWFILKRGHPLSQRPEIFSACPGSDKEKAADEEETCVGLNTASLLLSFFSGQAYNNE
jgi:hypothetical protein